MTNTIADQTTVTAATADAREPRVRILLKSYDDQEMYADSPEYVRVLFTRTELIQLLARAAAVREFGTVKDQGLHSITFRMEGQNWFVGYYDELDEEDRAAWLQWQKSLDIGHPVVIHDPTVNADVLPHDGVIVNTYGDTCVFEYSPVSDVEVRFRSEVRGGGCAVWTFAVPIRVFAEALAEFPEAPFDLSVFEDLRDGDYSDRARDKFVRANPKLLNAVRRAYEAVREVHPTVPMSLKLFNAEAANERQAKKRDLELVIDIPREPKDRGNIQWTRGHDAVIETVVDNQMHLIQQDGLEGVLRVYTLR